MMHNNTIGKKYITIVKNKAWIILITVYLAGITVTMSMMKVPPMMNFLIADLNTDTTTGGLFMSSFMIAGVVLAFPVASLLSRWGPKKSGLIAIGFTIAGSLFGSLAQTSSVMLLIGRFIEGIGFAGIMVIAPAVISMWFEPTTRGLPMGIWATWVPVGLFIIYNLAKPLESIFSWRGVWWFNAVFASIIALIYYLVIDYPYESNTIESREKLKNKKNANLKLGLKNLNIWRLTIIFFIIGMSIQGYNTWLPTFLVDFGLKESISNFNASLITMGSIPAIVTAGLMLTYTKRHKNILTTGLFLSIVTFSFWFRFGSIYVIAPWMILIGLSTGLSPTCIFTMATETVSQPEYIGFSLAMVNMGFNLGTIIGPPVIGMVISKCGWSPVKYFVVIPLMIGVMLAFNINDLK